MPVKPGASRRRQKTDRRAIATVEKQRQVLELRKAGADYETIAKKVGYANRSAAYKACQSALERVTKEPAEEVLALELGRLDGMLLGLWPNARIGHLGAIDRVLRIMERRSKYLGLDQTDTLDTAQASNMLADFMASLHQEFPDDELAP